MRLEELHNLWEEDSKIDRTELGEESLKIPMLHSKYFKLFSAERMALKQQESQYKLMYRIRYEYYMGTLDPETLKEYQWEPNPMRILKTDVPLYLDADEHLLKIQRSVDLQKEKVDFLESIIKQLPNRGFNIKSAIEFMKFQHGT